jgi:uncharacterized coiled-coil DUF342 family protein
MDEKSASWVMWALGAIVTGLTAIVAHLSGRISRAEDNSATIVREVRAQMAKDQESLKREIRSEFDKLWEKVDATNQEASHIRERIAGATLTRDELRRELDLLATRILNRGPQT